MQNNDISVGLDIGTTKIVAMVGRKNEYGKIDLLGIGKAKSLGVHRGVCEQYHTNHSLYSTSSGRGFYRIWYRIK